VKILRGGERAGRELLSATELCHKRSLRSKTILSHVELLEVERMVHFKPHWRKARNPKIGDGIPVARICAFNRKCKQSTEKVVLPIAKAARTE